MFVRMVRSFAVRKPGGYPMVVQLVDEVLTCIRSGKVVVLQHPRGAVDIPSDEFLRLCEQGDLVPAGPPIRAL